MRLRMMNRGLLDKMIRRHDARTVSALRLFAYGSRVCVQRVET